MSHEIILGVIGFGFFLFLFLLPGNFSEKIFLSFPALGPAALIYYFSNSLLFAFLWVLGFIILFFVGIMLALRRLT